jgi:hypothetical protein
MQRTQDGKARAGRITAVPYTGKGFTAPTDIVTRNWCEEEEGGSRNRKLQGSSRRREISLRY